MHKPLVIHAMNSLAHPLTICASLVILVNALLLQPQSPSWATGKLGDLGWMLVAPFLLALLIALLLPADTTLSTPRLGSIAIVTVGGGFALLKAAPAVNLAINGLAVSLGFPLKLRLDATDLMVLPALFLTWLVWNGKTIYQPSAFLRIAAVACAALAVIADAPAAPIHDMGFACLIEENNSLLAFRGIDYSGKNSWTNIYRSNDGGITWKEEINPKQKDWDLKCPERNVNWPITVPGAFVKLYYVVDQGIYRSDDFGKTLLLEQPISTVKDVYISVPNETVVFAAGRDGVWIRSVDTWKQVLGQPQESTP